MKKLLLFFLTAALLLSLPIAAYAATPEEIRYDFESAEELDDWKTIGGSWKIEDGCLKQTSGTPGAWNMHCALKDVKLKDFTVRIRMRVTKESLGTGWAALYFRKLNLEDNQEQSGYGLTMEGKNSKGKTVVVDWAHSSKTFEEQCKSNPGEWNDIVISVSGNTIRVYLNEDIAAKTPTMTIVDQDNGWKEAGYISLAAGNAKIDVDYFYLYSGSAQDKAFAGTDVTPTDPTEAPTDPPEVPTDPTQAPTDPTQAPTDPTEAPTDPTEEPVNTEDTQPQTRPDEQPDTVPSAAEDSGANEDPAGEKQDSDNPNWLSVVLGVIGVSGMAAVILIYVLGRKKTAK